MCTARNMRENDQMDQKNKNKQGCQKWKLVSKPRKAPETKKLWT